MSFDEKNAALIRALSALNGPSGFETAAAERAAELLAPLSDEVHIDRLGNVLAVRRCGKDKAKKLLWDAHLDEIGLIVTGHDKGFLRFGEIGGIDPRVLPDREVTLLTDPPVQGVITCLPPHLQSREDMEKAIPMEDLRIDAGLPPQRAEKEIPVGTPVVFRKQSFRMGRNCLCGNALDDRSCFAVLLRALELLKDRKLNVDLYLLGSVREEINGAGAIVGAYTVCPDYAVAVDVTHGVTSDSGREDAFPLGGGPAIGVGPNMNRALTERLKDAARRHDIPFGIEVMSGSSGTNGWDFQISREGVATAVLSLPLRYMHTPNEVISLADAEATAQLLAAFTEELTGKAEPC